MKQAKEGADCESWQNVGHCVVELIEKRRCESGRADTLRVWLRPGLRQIGILFLGFMLGNVFFHLSMILFF